MTAQHETVWLVWKTPYYDVDDEEFDAVYRTEERAVAVAEARNIQARAREHAVDAIPNDRWEAVEVPLR